MFYVQNSGNGPRSRKLQEAFELSIDYVIKSFSSDLISAGFPKAYRENREALESFRSDFIRKFKQEAIAKFESINASREVYKKLDDIDAILKSYADQGNLQADSESGALNREVSSLDLLQNPRKRAKVSENDGILDKASSFCKTSDIPTRDIIFDNAANIGKQVFQASRDYLTELEKDLDQIQGSVAILARELSDIWKNHDEYIGNIENFISRLLPETPKPCE